jgi:hypothetical protein
MDFKNHLKTAWEHTLQFIVPVILLTLVQVVVITCSFGILAPVTTAGYMQSLLRALRDGREPKIGDLFSEMRLIIPLSMFGLVAVLAIAIGFTLLIIPGLILTAFLLFATLYMMPLMTDQGMSLLDAIKESWNMAVEKPVTDQIILVVLYLVIVSLGSSVMVAVLFAQPLASFLVLSVYQERLQWVKQPSIAGAATPPPPPPSSDSEA